MGFFSSISKAIYREYDRRIKRASLITEYGASHHGHEQDHNEHTEAEHNNAGQHIEAQHTEEDDGAEIVNVPPGTPIEQSKSE